LSYSNDDLAVVPAEKRTWGTWNYAALWISMSLCVPSYMYAGGLIEGGMNWWEALLTVFLGNAIVLLPMLLNGHAGARYGIPFPVFARASFGIRGANVPAMLRAIVACGWFGIQTWIGGSSLYQIVTIWAPDFAKLPETFLARIGLQTGPAITFFLFWCLNMFVVYMGIESIRRLLLFKAVFLPLAALSLLAWALWAAKGLGPILAQPSKFESAAEFWRYFFPALTAMVGFWATLSLNIPDFTRYAKSQRAQIVGQAIGLPPSMTAIAFIGVVVTSATAIVYPKAIWDPVELAGRFDSHVLVTFALLAVMIATLATNIAANIVSPANDFSHLAPAYIDFKMGGYITGVVGALIMPWKLLADPHGYIFTWLVGYSSLLGPIGGILIVDYFLLRRQRLEPSELYSKEGRYWFQRGFNRFAILALVEGILPNVPGFLTTVKLLPPDSYPVFVIGLYNYAWFVGFAVSGTVYYLLSRIETRSLSEEMA
jgi:nucleobase:cation symporter-1, NCS1 family